MPEQTAYLTALMNYVTKCRPLLNQGEALPEPPQLSDFDKSLQDYREQVQAEVAQEAKAAGLTVEEYIASGSDAPAQPNFPSTKCRAARKGATSATVPMRACRQTGFPVDRKNYRLVYTAPLDKNPSLDEIYHRFNMEHPADYKGRSLSLGDIVVFRQDGKQTAYYVDRIGYREVPEFFEEQGQQLTPDKLETGEPVKTPRGTFYVTAMSREQMEAAGYGFHHQSEDGRYLIMQTAQGPLPSLPGRKAISRRGNVHRAKRNHD